MKDIRNRAFRTFGQVAFVESLIQLAVVFGVPIDNAQHAAIITVATPICAFLQNLAEEKGIVPTLGK